MMEEWWIEAHPQRGRDFYAYHFRSPWFTTELSQALIGTPKSEPGMVTVEREVVQS